MKKNALNLTAKMTIVFNRSKVNGELLLSCRKFFLIWIPLTLWNKLHPSHDGTTFTFQREEWWQRKETKAGMNKREKTNHTVSWWASGTPDGIICTSRDLGITPPVLLPTAQIEFLGLALFPAYCFLRWMSHASGHASPTSWATFTTLHSDLSWSSCRKSDHTTPYLDSATL